jgi:hypothetical protein
MKYLVIVFLLISCSKSVDHLPTVNKNSNVLESGLLIRNLDSTILSITLEPNVVCYSYQDGETSRPCDILVYATVHLSRPLVSELHIELKRENVGDDAEVVLVIAPNTATTILNTGFSNHDNQDVPDNVRIGKITVVPVIN